MSARAHGWGSSAARTIMRLLLNRRCCRLGTVIQPRARWARRLGRAVPIPLLYARAPGVVQTRPPHAGLAAQPHVHHRMCTQRELRLTRSAGERGRLAGQRAQARGRCCRGRRGRPGPRLPAAPRARARHAHGLQATLHAHARPESAKVSIQRNTVRVAGDQICAHDRSVALRDQEVRTRAHRGSGQHAKQLVY